MFVALVNKKVIRNTGICQFLPPLECSEWIAPKPEAGIVKLPQYSPNLNGSSKIVVIDRHPAIGDALSARLKKIPDFTYCGQAFTASEGMTLVEQSVPQVAILPLSLSDAYGLDLAAQLITLSKDTRLIIFSEFEEKIFAERAIEVGVMGYIMKSSPLDELLNCIKSVLRNETYLSTAMTVQLLNKITKGFSEATSHELDKLTHRELSVLLMMSEGSNPNEIASRLNLDRKTVETHRRRVKIKLDFANVSELIRFATQWRQSQGRLLPREFLNSASVEPSIQVAS